MADSTVAIVYPEPPASGYFSGPDRYRRMRRVQRRARLLNTGQPVNAYVWACEERDAYLTDCLSAIVRAA